ncbi:BglG family transcription antiterminator [Enterococcus sp. CSURQ0835]|uniref:BglG family transcription antiterminator n=1 Tax=Enterococcus sp. CSURQ0835 TaxID=2681394 RepID=UPI00135A2EFA|nr:transcription antiterminator [Enterococcus sp. CSURQ0835]
MYFSNREKKILKLLLDYPSGITIEELEQVLHVSKRTIYREISSIEKTIKALDVQIIKPRKAGYRLIGEKSALAALKTQLEKKQAAVFDTIQRQSALVCSLLLSETEITIESLAIDFLVSPATITTDLQVIETSVADYELTLIRLKGRGIKITGKEKAKRQILGNLIYNGVSEYDFFHFLDQLRPENLTQKSGNFFLDRLTTRSLYLAKTTLYHLATDAFDKVTDNQIQRVIVLLALSIDRITSQHGLEASSSAEPNPESMQVASQIMIKVATELKTAINRQEVQFLARQLEGINYKKTQNIFFADFDVELSYQIKELIRLVSEDTKTDFRSDEQLFNDLLAHMSAALKRNITPLKASNPLLVQIKEKYQLLTNAVTKELTTVFPEHDFSLDELGYVVIHFATSLERTPVGKTFSALVLCSSGIGTARILESRLKKYVPELKKIRVAKISEMNQLDFKPYDVILATVFLPGFQLPYKVISPLLLEEEITEIRGQLQRLQPAIRKVVVKEESESFEEIYEMMRVANNLLQSFEVRSIKADDTIETTLAQVIAALPETITSEPAFVTRKVIERYLVAPIGIPNSNFALFHSSNEKIKQPYFAIYDLDRTFLIPGMDKKSIELSRVLLLLAPDPLPENQKELLGKISSSIIESDLNTEIYKFGNQEIIYQLLSSLFVKEIRES